jgi:hypothetical protein
MFGEGTASPVARRRSRMRMIEGYHGGHYEAFCLLGYVLWRDPDVLEKSNFHLQDRRKKMAESRGKLSSLSLS